MARIRTVKPELWEDEVVGTLSREARLLFIATFNLADDEGLLRWTAPYIKASAFMYDDDLNVGDVAGVMAELTNSGLLFPYIGGMARQQMAVVVKFRKHQRINRPQKSKLPPPSLQNTEVRRMYGRRDGWACHLCGGPIPEKPVGDDRFNLSIDYLAAQGSGGSEHPSNLRAAHQACVEGRGNRPAEGFRTPPQTQGGSYSGSHSLNPSLHPQGPTPQEAATPGYGIPPAVAEDATHGDIYSVNDSVTGSLPSSPPEGKGREGRGTGNGGEGVAGACVREPVPVHEPADFTPPMHFPNAYEPFDMAPIDRDGFKLTEAAHRWAAATVPGIDVHQTTSLFVAHFRAQSVSRPNWFAEWQKWMIRESKFVSERAAKAAARPTPGSSGAVGSSGAPRPSTTDQRIQSAREAGRRVQALIDARNEEQA